MTAPSSLSPLFCALDPLLVMLRVQYLIKRPAGAPRALQELRFIELAKISAS